MKFTFGTLSGVDMLDTFQRLGIDLGSGSNKIVCDYGAGYAHIAQEIAALPSVCRVNCVDEDYPEAGEKIESFRQRINGIQNLGDFQSITPYDHFLYRLRKKVIVRFQQVLQTQGGLSDKITFHQTTKGLPDGSQDIVMANFLFSNLEFIHEVLFDCGRLLNENGILIITDHSEAFMECDGLAFIIKTIKELSILCPENERRPFDDDDPYGIKTIRIGAEDLDKIIQKVLEGTPPTGLEKITIDLNKVYPGEIIDDEESESEPWEAEYMLIPYERIAKQILSSQEVSLLKKVPHFKLEDYTRTRFKYWEDIIEGETPGEKLLRTHMLIFEKQNGRGGYEFSDNVDQETADFISKTIDSQETKL